MEPVETAIPHPRVCWVLAALSVSLVRIEVVQSTNAFQIETCRAGFPISPLRPQQNLSSGRQAGCEVSVKALDATGWLEKHQLWGQDLVTWG